MSTPHLHNYLRTRRKQIGFTQKDIAFLIGSNHLEKISRYEKLNQIPHITTVLTFEVIFQLPTRELFSGLFEKIEQQTQERARALLLEIKQQPAGVRTQRKVDHLKHLTRD